MNYKANKFYQFFWVDFLRTKYSDSQIIYYQRALKALTKSILPKENKMFCRKIKTKESKDECRKIKTFKGEKTIFVGKQKYFHERKNI